RLTQDLSGRAVLSARRFGFGENDAVAYAGGLRGAYQRAGLHRRRRHDRRAELRAAGEHDVSILRSVSAHDGRAERRVRAEAGPHAEEGDRRAGGADAGHGASDAVRQAQAAATLRRTAPARRARAFSGEAAETPAAR